MEEDIKSNEWEGVNCPPIQPSFKNRKSARCGRLINNEE